MEPFIKLCEDLPPDPYTGDPLSPLFVVFRPLADWPGYGIDSDGFPWSRWTLGCKPRLGNRWRRIAASFSGLYPFVRLQRDSRPHYQHVHTLVLTAFMGPCPDGMECCHRDGDPRNCRLSNLYWGTHAENMADRDRHGRTPYRGRIKVSSALPEIRSLLDEGVSARLIASRFGLHPQTIFSIKQGRTWKSGRVKCSILTEPQVREIRSLLGTGLSYRQIGDRFGVHFETIKAIKRGLTWKHVI